LALRRLLPLLVVPTVLLLLAPLGAAQAASGGGSSPPVTTPEIAPNPTVTVAVSHLPSSFNPWTAAGSDSVAQMIFAQVLPQASVVDPHLAPTICFADVTDCPEVLFTRAEEISINPATVVYDIVPSAHWSDGTPITATDFIYLWHEVLANAASLPANDALVGYEDISSITGSNGGRTVTVVFTHPYADWPALFTNLLPASVGARYGFADAFTNFDPAKDLSGGPFRIAQVIPGKEVILERNRAFWGPAPKVARIVFRVEPSETATLSALGTGAVTLAELPPGAAISAAVAGSDALVASTTASPVIWQLVFNTSDPLVASSLVRQAIATAVDRHQLIADTIGLLPGAVGGTVGNRLFPAGAPGSSGNDENYDTVDDPEADAQLTSAGDSVDAQGLVETAAGTPLTLRLLVPSGNELVANAAGQLQAELLQAGITLRIATVSPSDLLGKLLPSGEFELALAPYVVSAYPSETELLYTDPVSPSSADGVIGAGQDATVSPVGSEGGAVNSGAVTRDVLAFSDPKVSDLFDQATAELNSAADASLYNEIDTLLWTEMPTLPLFEMPVTIVNRTGLLNLSDSLSPAGVLWNAENWAVQLHPASTIPTTTTTSP
jgi:peptide/nickel transport system substrate-binding protein